MALLNFGKKNEDEKAAGCCSSSQTVSGENCCGDQNVNSEICCSGAFYESSCTIKVLGSGCKNCHILLENTKEAVKAMGLFVEVEYVTDMQKIMEYGIMSRPGLVVNEKVVSMGKVLEAADVAKLLHKLGF